MTWPALPKRIHYALKSLCYLAGGHGPVSARQVAQSAQIPPTEAAKILYTLAWGGFVRSRRGSKGGFWLQRPPQRIRVGDVVKLFSPPPDSSIASEHDPVLEVWEETSASSHEAFRRLSLEQLVGEGQAIRRLIYAGATEGHHRPAFTGSAAGPKRGG
jgi:Rrf2 family protein